MANEKQVDEMFVEQADTLVEQYKAYKSDMATYVRKSNTELYKLLGNMMQMCVDIDASNERGDIIKKLRNKLKNERDIKTQANSKTAAIVAKYVTGVTRKTAHVYARVIDTAMAAGVKADGLAAYIVANGGIDKVRQATVQTATKEMRKEYFDGQIEFARKELRERAALGVLEHSAGKRFNLQGYKGAEFTYAVCRRGEGGTLEVVATLAQDKQLEEYALRCFANNLELAQLEQTLESNTFIETCEERGSKSDVVHSWMRDNNIAKQWEQKTLQQQVLEQEELLAA